MLRTIGLVIAASLMHWGTCAVAQIYPSRPVTLVVPFAPGGTTDIVARLVAQQLTGSLGSVIVENRSGGGGVVGWRSVAAAKPDGYTVLTADLSFAIAAGFLPDLQFDARQDFAPITFAVSVPHVLAVNPDLPAKTFQDFVAQAKAAPGKLFYGSGGVGTNAHFAFELFKSATGIDVTHVAFRGAGAVIPEVMAGRIQAATIAVPGALPFIKAGTLRGLLVMSDTRSPVLPDVPSAKDVGFAQLDMRFWISFVVPAKTPREIIERLNKDIKAALTSPVVKKRFDDLGLDVVASTPAEAATFIDSEIVRYGALAKTAGIKPE